MPVVSGKPQNPSRKSMEKEESIPERDKQERLDDLEKATKLYGNIRSKSTKILPMLDDVAKDILAFQYYCQQVPALRAVYLSRRLVSDPLMKIILGSRHQLKQLVKVSERAELNISGIEDEIINPGLLK